MIQESNYPIGILQEAIFVKRENRFRAEVELNGQRIKVHVPNSGRMRELLTPGASVWIQPAKDESKKRKTAYTLVLARQQERYICLHAHFANELIAFWLQHDILPEFAGATKIEREKPYGTSRMDFRLYREQRCCYVEVKSVNLLDGDTARFPDAPTSRGSKHLRELIACKADGMDAAVVFLVMGNDAKQFAPNWKMDATFAKTLMLAQSKGVEVYVYTCEVSLQGVRYTGRIPIQEESEWKSMR